MCNSLTGDTLGGQVGFGAMTSRQGHPMLSVVPTPGLNGYSKPWS